MEQIELLTTVLRKQAPYTDLLPNRPTIWRLGHVWAKGYADPFFLKLRNNQGWYTDWVRASKHWFLGYMLRDVCWEAGYVPSSSEEVLKEPLEILLRWMEGHNAHDYKEVPRPIQVANYKSRKVEVHALLGNYEFVLWDLANQRRIKNFEQYSLRNPRNIIPPEEWPQRWHKQGVPY